MEYMYIFFIACLSESNLWMFLLVFVYKCYAGGDLDIV